MCASLVDGTIEISWFVAPQFGAFYSFKIFMDMFGFGLQKMEIAMAEMTLTLFLIHS